MVKVKTKSFKIKANKYIKKVKFAAQQLQNKYCTVNRKTKTLTNSYYNAI